MGRHGWSLSCVALLIICVCAGMGEELNRKTDSSQRKVAARVHRHEQGFIGPVQLEVDAKVRTKSGSSESSDSDAYRFAGKRGLFDKIKKGLKAFGKAAMTVGSAAVKEVGANFQPGGANGFPTLLSAIAKPTGNLAKLAAGVIGDYNAAVAKGQVPPQPRPYGIGSPQINGQASRITPADSACVMCQYVLQRLQSEMALNNIGVRIFPHEDPYADLRDAWRKSELADMAFRTPPPPGGGGGSAGGGESAGESAFLELESSAEQAPDSSSFVEATATTTARTHAQVSLRAHRQQARTLQLERERFRQQLQNRYVPPFKETKHFQSRPPRIPPFPPHGPPPPQYRSQKSWKTRQERFDDFWVWRPTTARYNDLYDVTIKAEKRAQEKFAEQQMFKLIFPTMENLCVKHFPRAYYGICGKLMRDFRLISTGLLHRESPALVCMTMDFCSLASYVQTGPHARNSVS